jgi:hypothetical protein
VRPLGVSLKHPQSSQLQPVSGVAVTVNGEVTSVVVGAAIMTPPSPEQPSPQSSSPNVTLSAPDELESAADVELSPLEDEASPLDDEPSLDDDESPPHACRETKLSTHTHPSPTIQRMTAVYQCRQRTR